MKKHMSIKKLITKKNIYIVISLLFVIASIIALFWGSFDWNANIYFYQDVNGNPSETSQVFSDTVYYYNLVFPITNDGIINDLIKVAVKYELLEDTNHFCKWYMPYMFLMPMFVLALVMLPGIAEYEKKPLFKKIKYLVAAFLILFSVVVIFVETKMVQTFLENLLTTADPKNLIHLDKSTTTVVRYIYPDLTLIMMLVMSYFMIDLAFTKKNN